MLKFQLINKKNEVLLEKEGTHIPVFYPAPYEAGDRMEVTLEGDYLAIKANPYMAESIVYVPDHKFVFPIPQEGKRVAYHPDAWTGSENFIWVREPEEEEIYSYRNLALNSTAVRYEERYFPYAKANYVTRDEVCFEERNSIDGIIRSESHGNYPYHSYAGGAREDIDYTLYLGKPAKVDRLVFYLRADFVNDHDTYWKSLTVEFSDGTRLPLTFEKSGGAQEVKLEKPIITDSIHLTDFKQAACPLSWAALTQIQVFGRIER